MKKFARISKWIYLGMLAITPFLCGLIVELSCNPKIETLRPLPMAVEIFIFALIELVLVGFIPFFSIGLSLCYIISLCYGALNFYLLKFRDIPFMLMDIWEAKTAAAVMGSYDFTPGKRLVIAAVIGVVSIIISGVTFGSFWKTYGKRLRYLFWASMGVIGAGGLFWLIGFVGFSYYFDITMDLWKPGRTYAENGAVTSFICYAQFSTIEEPEGYEKEEVAEILLKAKEEYDRKYGSDDSFSAGKINVLGIMNEAFGDLSVLGPLECTQNHLTFYNSLKEDPNTIWQGYSYVSTYAGGTARTEFEWLTGFSMRMFRNAQPYAQFNFDDIATPIKGINAAGYDTIAMHPENPRNYRRNTAYEQMGFDTFLSKEAFRAYENVSFIKTRTSDMGDFKRMIDEDSRRVTPTFFHNVTMQNHGGYEFNTNGESVVVDEKYEDVRELVKYETLLAKTDEAFEMLINHYRESEEPVVICMYGDHLPTMPEDFVAKLMEAGFDSEKNDTENQERRFKVPFVLWANSSAQDLLEQDETTKAYIQGTDVVTSANYLGVITRKLAGLPISAFDKYMLLMRQEIPVINESGYIAGNEWHPGNDDSIYQEKLLEYSKIQYAGMFDIEGLEELYGIPD